MDPLVQQLGVHRGRRLIHMLGVVQHPQHFLALDMAERPRLR
jgi:hypothetical protein